MKYNKDLAGIQITDELINRASSAAARLAHDTILRSTVVVRTAPGGGGTLLAMTTDYTLGSEDTRLTTEAGGTVNTTLAVVNGAYQNTNLYVSYKTVGDYAEADDINEIGRFIIEKSKKVGEIFALLDRRAPAAYTGDLDAYFPAVCLTDIDSQITLNATNAPDAVPYLRARKMIFEDGLSGELAALSVTNWAINANVATLTFANNTDTIAALAALGEDQAVHGSYTNWRSITLDNAIGNITAGDYAITNVNPSARTISFAFTAANASGAVSASAEFYPFRIPGSTTTARIFTGRGLTLHGANDANGYFVSGGLRRRGFMQGHDIGKYNTPTSKISTYTASASPASAGGATTGTDIIQYTANLAAGNVTRAVPVDNGIDGTPRTAAETHGPAMTVHLYMHLGRLI